MTRAQIDLIRIGNMMSNVMYILAQQSGKTLTEEWTDEMKDLQVKWDEKIEEVLGM